jgi:hypothetical protein
MSITTLSKISILFFFLMSIPFVWATPVGITVLTNQTSTLPTVSTSRADDGGTITTLTVDAQQQDDLWKGYVGNVTGKFTLADSANYSIYDWTFSVTTGEIYISRASSPNWSSAGCLNPVILSSEQSYFGMIDTDYDTINKTFNETTHKNFRVGPINITNSTCKTSLLYVNASKNDSVSENSPFQEVLLQMNGTTNALVYAAILETDHIGFNPTKTFDFQAIVPDNRTFGGVTTYYFWAELGY